MRTATGYHVNAASRLTTTVMRGTTAPSTAKFISNRPSEATAYCDFADSGGMLAPLASRVRKRGTGAPIQGPASTPTTIGTAIKRASGAT